jgi:adenylate cyclase
VFRRSLIGLAIGIVAAMLAAAVGLTSRARTFEDLTYDWRLTSTRGGTPAPDIVVIEINESSLRTLELRFGRWPWPRFLHASAIDFLTRAHARVIAYDVLLTEPDTRGSFPVGTNRMTGAESDGQLVAAVRRAGNVVLLADATYEGLPGESAEPPPDLPGPVYSAGSGFQARPHLRVPFGGLAAAAAAIGHDGLIHDPGSSITRRILPFIDRAGVLVPSLGVAAAITGRVRARDIAVDGDVLRVGDTALPLLDEPVPGADGRPPAPSRQALIHYRGPLHSAGTATLYPTYSFFDVLLSEDQLANHQTPTLDPALFTNKIVFVGTSAAGLFDVQDTPFSPPGVPGVQIHAASADDILTGHVMRRASLGTDLVVALAAGIAAALAAVLLPVAWGTGAVAIVAIGLVMWTRSAVADGVWIGLVTPLVALALSLFGGVAWQYFVEGREKRRVKALFGRYVSKDVFQALMADPSRARLGGVRIDMTVLFSDIRGFTTASEKSTPEAVVAQLNEYFSEMVEILFRHQGTLDKFVGDMVMGLFGAPVADPQHADHAVATALEMVSALRRLNARWVSEGRAPLDIGIGINSGEMIAGNIGSNAIMSYTVIGDAVNLGSRLESLNKEYGTHILISQATRDKLTTPVDTRRIGDVKVKGKTQAVTVWEVLVPDADKLF